MTMQPETNSQTAHPVIIVSNRGPVTTSQNEIGEYEFQRSAGGLVTALTGLARLLDLTWISCASNASDAAWGEGRVPLTDEGDLIRIKFLTPDEQAYEGYYNVIANPLLWFLQHSMWDVPRAPIINRLTWQAWNDGYVQVNRLFAQEIANQITRTSRPALVMLQDYHLYLVTRYLRDAISLRNVTMLQFIHIPWPGPEYWGILPPSMRHAILQGLCAVDLLGFQTREDALNFMRTCDSYLPKVHIKYNRGRVWYQNHATHVRDFPISIDVGALKRMAESDEVKQYDAEIQGIVGDRKLILRIDRIEPSKNIIRGFHAFEETLEIHPEYCGQVTFLALLVPSRLGVNEYQSYLDELMAAAGRINAFYGNSEWEPVRILVGENYARAVAALKQYDVLLVNAIADGMNLVAKEGPTVNERDGVLILSERAGAQQQLESGAIIISPCDVYATAEAMHQALIMPAEQRQAYAERLRWLIEREDINAWLKWQFDAMADLNLL
ncbi:MAG: alpha,alpha-trehalose-phosphate synthase (UDP-forming) [Chloroflexota bacterium]